MEEIVKIYNSEKGLELEATFHLKSIPDIQGKYSVIKQVNIFYENGYRTTKFFNEKEMINEITIYKKRIKTIKTEDYTLKLSNEIPKGKYFTSKIKTINIKYRMEYEREGYIIDLDLIKNVNINERNIKKVKNTFLNNPFENFDSVILELEVKTDNITIEFLNEMLNFELNDYQDYIYKIAKVLIKDEFYLKKFKNKYGLKQLLPNVKEIDKNLYNKEIYKNKDDYIITDKIDGLRCIIYIEEKGNSINVKLIMDKLYQVKEYDDEVKNGKVTIFDSECIMKKQESNIVSINDISLYIFDIFMEGDFKERMKHLIKPFPSCHIKEFITFDKIKEFYEKKRNYLIDGLIFVPLTGNNPGYKWKPVKDLSIDFYVCRNKDHYILFSGINIKDFEKLNMEYLHNYHNIIPEKYHSGNYFPIQFSPSDNPMLYIYNTNLDIHNTISEFIYDNGKLKFKKIREDRMIELNRGNYFGNYYKVSEMIWVTMQNPLMLDDLINPKRSYFMEDDVVMYKQLRNFNSLVKTKLLSLIPEQERRWLLDLASGKGQDLARITNLEYQNALFLDNDKNALSELINRKLNLRTNRPRIVKTFVQEMDLSIDSKTIINKILTKFPQINQKVFNVIVCNFALHYFIENKENLKKVIKYFVKDGGYLIYTIFDYKKVLAILNGNDTWNKYENDTLKYSIKKINEEEVEVLLPFSNKEYYREKLITEDLYENSLSGNFSNFWYQDDGLSEADREFSSLYKYVFTKF